MSASPTFLSPIPEGTDISAAKVGSDLLRLPLHPQGDLIAGVMQASGQDGARLYPEVAVQVPRRGQKTTSIWAVLMGRCETTEDHKVIVTAQDGTRARARWRDVARSVERTAPHIRTRWAAGDESFEWENGSRLWVVPPKSGAFRSEAADTIFFDEAGELSPEEADDLREGVLPLMDTRPAGQVVIAGTPGTARAGLLWDSLTAGRSGAPGSGIVDYSLAEDESFLIVADDGTVTLDEELLRRVHPGIGTLTTMTRMRERFAKMQHVSFEREYGCRWPADNATSALDLDAWARSAVAPTDRPDRVAIAFDCAVDGTSASIVYAWRVDGVAYVELVAHRAGTSWVPNLAHQAARKYRGVPITYDSIGANLDPAQALSRLRPVVRGNPLMTKPVMGAAQRLASDLHEGRVRHFGQQDLDAAVQNTAWRQVQHSGRAFGRKVASGASISPLVAASLAVWAYDAGRDRTPLTIAV